MSRGLPATRSPTSCSTRVRVRLRKHDLPHRGHGRCVKLRLRRTIFAFGRSSGSVMPSVGSGKYCPGPDTATPSLATSSAGLYRICARVIPFHAMMLKTRFSSPRVFLRTLVLLAYFLLRDTLRENNSNKRKGGPSHAELHHYSRTHKRNGQFH